MATGSKPSSSKSPSAKSSSKPATTKTRKVLTPEQAYAAAEKKFKAAQAKLAASKLDGEIASAKVAGNKTFKDLFADLSKQHKVDNIAILTSIGKAVGIKRLVISQADAVKRAVKK